MRSYLIEIIRIAQQKKVKFGKFQIVDSVHLVADVNLGFISVFSVRPSLVHCIL